MVHGRVCSLAHGSLLQYHTASMKLNWHLYSLCWLGIEDKTIVHSKLEIHPVNKADSMVFLLCFGKSLWGSEHIWNSFHSYCIDPHRKICTLNHLVLCHQHKNRTHDSPRRRICQGRIQNNLQTGRVPLLPLFGRVGTCWLGMFGSLGKGHRFGFDRCCGCKFDIHWLLQQILFPACNICSRWNCRVR